MKRYFAAQSEHGSATSYGFSNDTTVFVFNGKKNRDKFIEESSNLSCKAIKYNDVTKHATNWSMTHNCNIKPHTFDGEFWGIEPLIDDDIDGCIGIVCVCQAENIFVEKLYK